MKNVKREGKKVRNGKNTLSASGEFEQSTG